MNTYTLKVGKSGTDRLSLLHDIYLPYSLSFIRDLIVPGIKILDVGCGTALLSLELAKKIGEHGHITAIDISLEQLEIAKNNAIRENCRNISFLQGNVESISKIVDDKFDLIICKSILVHLKQPENVIKVLTNLLLPGGHIFCEETTGLETMYSMPTSSYFDDCLDAFLQQEKVYNTDFSFGQKLPKLLQKNELQLERMCTLQPALITPEHKSILRLGIIEISDNLIKNNLKSRKALDVIKDNLSYLESEEYIIGYCRMIQIYASKFIRN